MAQSAANTVVPGRAFLYIGPVSTTAPADESAALAAGFVEMGFTKEDGTSFATEPTFVEVKAHQSDFPIRKFLSDNKAKITCRLLEWSTPTFKAVFGGGTVAQVAAGKFRYDPPAGTTDVVQAILDIADGAKKYRFVFPRVRSTEGTDISLSRTEPGELPLTLEVEGTGVGSAFYVLTNDPAFVVG